MKQVVMGTAGHIDHGKTQLVKTLTGIDTDRLKEEKERGITIDLGFAHLTYEDGTEVGVIDVPGHERFVSNMLAGAAGLDLVLLVIAADESIKPQTREHFAIYKLLGIPTGLVALTKSDLVDRDILELVRLEVEELVAGGFLEGKPIVPVSSTTGAGLDELRAAILQSVANVDDRDATRRVFRLPIDRVFTMKGFGSVITGTGDPSATLPAVYPNPSNDGSIFVKEGVEKIRMITVYDPAGKAVLHNETSIEAVTEIPVRMMANGLYVIEIRTAKAVYRDKVVIKN